MTGALRPRAAAAVAACALVLSACGGDQPPGLSGSEHTSTPPDTTVAAHAGAAGPTPAPGPATPAPPAAPTPSTQIPRTVDLAPPDLLVRPDDDVATPLEAATKVKGVRHLAGASEFRARFAIPRSQLHAAHGDERRLSKRQARRRTRVTVLGVDPVAFRPLTPEITAQEAGVWQRLAEGDVVVRHDVADKLGLTLGETYRLVGPSGELEVRIGAFASNGAPPLAEVLVPWELAIQLGAGDVNLLVVSARKGAEPEELGERLVRRLDGGAFELRSAPEEQQAQLVGTGEHHFEPFDYTDLGDGMIVIDPAWVSRWIATVELPGLGSTRCHRVMIPQLLAALEEIQAAGLYGHFKPDQFGGCYMPRHIDWDPTKPLSMHAWGLAIDLNTHDNWLGDRPQMDPRIVEIFERWGFEWGGRWPRPDGMHFELDRVIDVGG